jgi:hypothetical protein
MNYGRVIRHLATNFQARGHSIECDIPLHCMLYTKYHWPIIPYLSESYKLINHDYIKILNSVSCHSHLVWSKSWENSTREPAPSEKKTWYYYREIQSRAHHTKQLYFAGLMHKLQDIQYLLLMFMTLYLRNAKSNHIFTIYGRNGFPVRQCMRELFLPCLRPLYGASVNWCC